MTIEVVETDWLKRMFAVCIAQDQRFTWSRAELFSQNDDLHPWATFAHNGRSFIVDSRAGRIVFEIHVPPDHPTAGLLRKCKVFASCAGETGLALEITCAQPAAHVVTAVHPESRAGILHADAKYNTAPPALLVTVQLGAPQSVAVEADDVRVFAEHVLAMEFDCAMRILKQRKRENAKQFEKLQSQLKQHCKANLALFLEQKIGQIHVLAHNDALYAAYSFLDGSEFHADYRFCNIVPGHWIDSTRRYAVRLPNAMHRYIRFCGNVEDCGNTQESALAAHSHKCKISTDYWGSDTFTVKMLANSTNVLRVRRCTEGGSNGYPAPRDFYSGYWHAASIYGGGHTHSVSATSGGVNPNVGDVGVGYSMEPMHFTVRACILTNFNELTNSF